MMAASVMTDAMAGRWRELCGLGKADA